MFEAAQIRVHQQTKLTLDEHKALVLGNQELQTFPRKMPCPLVHYYMDHCMQRKGTANHSDRSEGCYPQQGHCNVLEEGEEGLRQGGPVMPSQVQ